MSRVVATRERVTLRFALQVVVILMLLTGVVNCHAQCWTGPVGYGIVTVSPTYVAPGQTVSAALISSSNYPDFISLPAGGAESFYVVTPAAWALGHYLAEDPNVTVSQPTYVSQNELDFTLSVNAAAPTEGDGFSLNCTTPMNTPSVIDIFGEPPIIQITPCAITPAPTITSVQPAVWGAGQATAITITGTNFVAENNINGCRLSVLDILAGNQGIPISNQVNVSPTEITAVVTPSPSTTAKTGGVQVGNWDLNANNFVVSSTLPVQIPSCPIPTVTSISPNVWLAGQTYNNITIAGKNFTTPAKATSTCPTTTVTALAGASGARSVLGAITVNSATQITISSVSPPANETTEGVQVELSGAKISNTLSGFDNADVLEVPTITWASDPDGTSPTISGPNAILPNPSAVVGQQIQLTTTPTAATLAGLPIPVSFAATAPTTWTLTGGTNIGGYTVVAPTTGAPTVSSATIASVSLNGSSVTFYPTATSSPTVTYSYCVSGLTTCSKATASFAIGGPTGVTVTPSGQTFFITADNEGMIWGIQFNATATSPANDSGVYTWVQLLQSYSEVANLDDGTTDTCAGGPGLDTSVPYSTGLSAEDGPEDALAPTVQTSENDSLNFQMYLMWDPGTTNSIPVALAEVPWTASGNVTWSSANNDWTVVSGGTTSGIVNASPSQPIWGTAITKDSLVASCN
jgi:hypothetical protein